MSLNKVMLIGNVGQDPEVRYIPNSQTKVATLRLATTDRRNDRNGGEPREFTEWHTVVCWRNLADLAEKYIRKGTQIYVDGRLQTREWTDQNGAKRYSTEIVANDIQLLGKRSDNPAAQQNAGSSYNAPAQNVGGYQQPYQPSQPAVQQPVVSPVPQPSAAPMGSFDGAGDDDLPF